MTRYAARHLLLAATLTVAACSSTDDGPPPPTDSIVVTGEPSNGQLTIGEAVELYAEVQDSAHKPIGCLYPLRWTNSNPAAVRMQESFPGAVQAYAQAVGTAELTVTCEQLKTSVPVKVVLLPVDSVDIRPDSAAAIVGNKVQFTATVYDSVGRQLFDRVITWSSSATGTVRMDAQGEATAVSAGTARVAATSEGKSASAYWVSVAATNGDWNAVTSDWVTFQGDSMHTGFVPATVDARTFRRLWQVAPGPDWLHAAVAVDNFVYVTTRQSFGQKFLYALDAATGATVWSHDFGAVESVNPPAFGANAVFVQNGGQDDSYLWAFEAATGAERFHSPFVNQWTHFFAPVVSGGSVYAGGGYGAGVYAYNALTGAQLWFTELPPTGDYTPAVRDGQVYAHPGYPNWGPVALSVMSTSTGTMLYDIPATGPGGFSGYALSSAPALGGDHAYICSDGRIIAYDLTNRNVAWQKLDTFHGQVTVTPSALYVYNGDRVEARAPSDGHFLWAWAPASGLDHWAQVVATNNLLFVSTSGATYALDLASHLPIWSTPVNGFLSISRDGTLYIAQESGQLTAIVLK